MWRPRVLALVEQCRLEVTQKGCLAVSPVCVLVSGVAASVHKCQQHRVTVT